MINIKVKKLSLELNTFYLEAPRKVRILFQAYLPKLKTNMNYVFLILSIIP